MTTIPLPRPEHPRPQFMRDSWINLNGKWSYTFDFGESGMAHARKLYESKGFEDSITVPFCPESKLSGVEHKDFIRAMWYQRTIEIGREYASDPSLTSSVVHSNSRQSSNTVGANYTRFSQSIW